MYDDDNLENWYAFKKQMFLSSNSRVSLEK